MALKLLFLIDKLSFGGAEKITLELAEKLSENKHFSVKILSLNKTNFELTNNKIDVSFLKKDINKFFYFWRYKEAFKIIRDYNPHIIQSSMESADWLAGTYKLLNPGVKIISAIHTYLKNRQHKIKWKHKLQFLLQGFLYRRLDHIVCVSNDLKQYIIDNFHIKPAKIRTIYNGVRQPDTFPKYNIHKKFTKRLVFIGGLRAVKNISILFKVIQKLPEYTLNIFGQGSELMVLKETVQKNGLQERIFFSGFKSSAYQELTQYDILVLPSYYESFSLTALEGLIVGIPTLCTKFGGGKELYVGRLEELLINPFDAEDIIEKILFIENNFRQVVSDILKQRKYFVHFSIENMSGMYSELYEELFPL